MPDKRKITKFTTVSHEAFSTEGNMRFPKKVQDLVDKGWQPYGDVFVVTPRAAHLQPHVALAMVQYEEAQDAS